MLPEEGAVKLHSSLLPMRKSKPSDQTLSGRGVSSSFKLRGGAPWGKGSPQVQNWGPRDGEQGHLPRSDRCRHCRRRNHRTEDCYSPKARGHSWRREPRREGVISAEGSPGSGDFTTLWDGRTNDSPGDPDTVETVVPGQPLAALRVSTIQQLGAGTGTSEEEDPLGDEFNHGQYFLQHMYGNALVRDMMGPSPFDSVPVVSEITSILNPLVVESEHAEAQVPSQPLGKEVESPTVEDKPVTSDDWARLQAAKQLVSEITSILKPSHPPITLPKIESTLNPNAPIFTSHGVEPDRTPLGKSGRRNPRVIQ